MDPPSTTPRAPPSVSTGMDGSEELLAEIDEPPEQHFQDYQLPWALPTAFGKALPNIFQRRESLLTRQLHSEPEHTDDDNDDDVPSTEPARALSTQSTWSAASTAELTSDDGRSVPSPTITPPLPPTTVTPMIPLGEKMLAREPKIVAQDEVAVPKQAIPGSERSVEAGLGRKRCISFACGGKRAPTSQPATEPPPPPPTTATTASPPKRKCMLTFVCPSKMASTSKPVDKPAPSAKRPVSPPPPARRPSSGVRIEGLRGHRGSDSTVTHPSPKSTRKAPFTTNAVQGPALPDTGAHRRTLSNDSDASTEATRFHEFATSDDEPEEWVQESTCHRSRLTVNDTLQKENIIRKACQEVEEEAVEEDEDEEDAIDNDGNDDDDDDDAEDDAVDDDDDDLSDDGFRTDDEDGFADSDSEVDDSDEEWWRPGGPSTAATSIEHLDRIFSHAKSEDATVPSSINSASSGRVSPRMPASRRRHPRTREDALPIRNRPATTDLPDSTDFVCGTLDEDRPLEQAYLNSLQQRKAAKHVVRPQDIDPSFPTSDPEMDEEDDEDLVEPLPSESENFMHGELDELDGDLTARRRLSPRPRARPNPARSPAPPVRHRSPPPPKRSQQHAARSPPPPRRMARSPPPPRKLFGVSPSPARSPSPSNRFTSPPTTRRTSLITPGVLDHAHHGFASRSHVTHTASLPRGGGFMLSRLNTLHLTDDNGHDKDNDDDDDANAAGHGNVESPILPKRGAIDIVKGLERKRQRRKERLYAKACAKAAAKGEKAYKVKPGKGAERMREVGLELQRYHGKGEHILSM